MNDAPNPTTIASAPPAETTTKITPRGATKSGRVVPTPRVSGAAAWVSLGAASAYLGTSPDALRRLLERRATRAPDGGIEADVDGVRARKLGRLWRVRFSASWQTGGAR